MSRLVGGGRFGDECGRFLEADSGLSGLSPAGVVGSPSREGSGRFVFEPGVSSETSRSELAGVRYLIDSAL